MARAKSAGSNRTSGTKSRELISDDERQRMISEAAYFRAQARDFQNGDPLDDWLAAERQINQALPPARQQKHELQAYEKLRRSVSTVLAEARDTVNAETLKQAFDRATTELKKTGEYTAETTNRIATSLRKDMANAANKMGPKWEAFSDKTADLFSVWRDRSSLFLARAAEGVADWLHQAGDKLEPQIYQTGDMVHTGTFECTACGELLVLHTPAHLPPCARCRKLIFRRI